jgi:chemotaxis protein MotB
MADKSSQPIVVKKIVQGGGHHGGSWKVAYADFVTAMMAFFLLMWLMGSTTKEQKAAISEYFNNPSPEEGTSLKPSPSAIQGPGGSGSSLLDQGGVGVLSAEEKTVSDASESPEEEKKEAVDEQNAKEAAEKSFRERVEQMLEELKELTRKSETLRQYADQLLFDLTSEGLRIQVIDKENRPMFDVGSAALKPHTIEILREITKVINEINSPVSISGHTDARRLDRAGYSNWELSTERANAARRALVASGIAEGKVARVVGLASSQLFNTGDPMDSTNRRVSITVLSPDSVSRNAESPVAGDAAAAPHTVAPAPAAAPPETPHGNGNGSRKSKP